MEPQTRVPYRILLADDHVLIRLGLKNLMGTDPSLQVIGEVGNGEELFLFLERQRPDLLILDISMPRINGIEALVRVKALFPRIKVLILTMHKNRLYFHRAMEAGADGYLMKDDSDEELLQAIAILRGGGIYRSPLLTQELSDPAIVLPRASGAELLAGLTERERQILPLVAAGHTSKTVADMLLVSPRTVEYYRGKLLKRFQLKNSVDLVNFVRANGLVTGEL